MAGRIPPRPPRRLLRPLPQPLRPLRTRRNPRGLGIKETRGDCRTCLRQTFASSRPKGRSCSRVWIKRTIRLAQQKTSSRPRHCRRQKSNPGVVTWVYCGFFAIDTTFYVELRDASEGLHFNFFALTDQDLPSVSADSAVPGLNRNLAYVNEQLVPARKIVDELNDRICAVFTRRHNLEKESRTLDDQRDVPLQRLVSVEVRLSPLEGGNSSLKVR